MFLLVCGGLESRMIDLALRPGAARPTDLARLLDLVGRTEPSTNLVLRVASVKRGVTWDGREMPDLPPSIVSAMANGIQSGVVAPLVEDEVHRLQTPWIITGNTRMKLRVVE
jgi:hypothetical protein